MAKRFLVVLDYSENAVRAFKFVAETFSAEHEIILFSAIPSTAGLCDLEADTLIPQFSFQQKAFFQVEQEKKATLETLMESPLFRDQGF
jgi:hypothetical protein